MKKRWVAPPSPAANFPFVSFFILSFLRGGATYYKKGRGKVLLRTKKKDLGEGRCFFQGFVAVAFSSILLPSICHPPPPPPIRLDTEKGNTCTMARSQSSPPEMGGVRGRRSVPSFGKIPTSTSLPEALGQSDCGRKVAQVSPRELRRLARYGATPGCRPPELCGKCCSVGTLDGKRKVVILDLDVVVVYDPIPTANLAHMEGLENSKTRKAWTVHKIQKDTWTIRLHVNNASAEVLKQVVANCAVAGLDFGVWLNCCERAARTFVVQALGRETYRRLAFVYGEEYGHEVVTSGTVGDSFSIPSYRIAKLLQDPAHACKSCKAPLWGAAQVVASDPSLFLKYNDERNVHVVLVSANVAGRRPVYDSIARPLPHVLADILSVHAKGMEVGGRQSMLCDLASEVTQRRKQVASLEDADKDARTRKPPSSSSGDGEVVARERTASCVPFFGCL